VRPPRLWRETGSSWLRLLAVLGVVGVVVALVPEGHLGERPGVDHDRSREGFLDLLVVLDEELHVLHELTPNM